MRGKVGKQFLTLRKGRVARSAAEGDRRARQWPAASLVEQVVVEIEPRL